MSRSPLQLGLPFPPPSGSETEELAQRLGRFLAERLESLVLTTNSSTFLTARLLGRGRGMAVRLHRGFVHAPDEVLAMIATFCETSSRRRRSEALEVLRAFFAAVSATPRARRSRPRRRRGRHHDLEAIFAELNRRYFAERLDVSITWSAVRRTGRRRRRRSRTLQLGSYCWDDNLIRIHPVLDHPDVPRVVVAAVVHHEMLHAAVPPQLVAGRRYVHTAEFRRREREFDGLEEADRWLDARLSELLTRRDRGLR